MNREIKFRVWRGSYFIYSDRSVEGGGFRESLTLTQDGFASEHDGSDWDWGPYENIMQYTGLKDRNGVEIYEGDVVREVSWKPDQQEDVRHEIKWYPSNCSFGFSGRMQICESDARDWEVIGNIYQNPEL